jgi:pantoate--beta-alanine ligase
MKIVRSPTAMQRLAMNWRRSDRRVAFVPTMGFLHDGHVSLMHAARRRVGPRGIVVVSIYVNPTQFAPTEDLSRYPRDFDGDRSRCAAAGVDVIFAPLDSDMYSGRAEQRYSTYVVEEQLGLGMEGASRPTHFRGVTTVVAKLFNVVLPDVAVFGAKDWQQAAVIRRMIQDLNFPLRIVVAPTRREKDGLAMSSRNAYLGPEERLQATVLIRSIRAVRARVKVAGEKTISAEHLKAEVAGLVAQQPAARLDYVEFFDPKELRPLTEVRRGSQMALAVFVGKTRLIDNGPV